MEKQLLLRVLNSEAEMIEGNNETKLIHDCKLSDGSLIYAEELKVDATLLPSSSM